MPVSNNKINELIKFGYKYHSTNQLYFNKSKKIIISQLAIDDHNDNWLDEQLNGSHNDDWHFIFNENPSDVQKKDILKKLGL